MARFYCNLAKLSDVVSRVSKGMSEDASRLTFVHKQEIMAEPGIRNLRVPVALTKSKGLYERLQPQGGRSIGAHQQIGSRGREHGGERSGGTAQLSQRRGSTGGPSALDKSLAHRSGENDPPRRLYGKASSSPQVDDSFLCHLERYLSPTRNHCATTALAILLLSFSLTGCGGHKQAHVDVPPPPPMSEPDSQTKSVNTEPSAKTIVPAPTEQDALGIPADAKPISVQTGLASWYGAPYHNRRGSNGELYNMNAMTAAHRTLPLGSIVRVTNVKTGHSALVRITDRGPFVEGRVLDLSQAAAKKVDVLQPGVAMVRIEVLRTPSSLETGGRWAVQIGAFEQEHAADKLADHLSHRYQTAKVQCFSSPVGDWWVRVRVQDDNRKLAEEVARTTQTSQGSIFLVRLD